MSQFHASLPWRTGRRVHRTVYAQVTPEPSDADVLVGLMDSAALATEAVTAHNAKRARVLAAANGHDESDLALLDGTPGAE